MHRTTMLRIAAAGLVLAPTAIAWYLALRERFARPGSRHWLDPASALARAEDAECDDGHMGSASDTEYWGRLAERNAAKLAEDRGNCPASDQPPRYGS